MTGIALIMAIVGIWGGISLIKSGSKNLEAIIFPASFYEKLRYFKLDKNTVVAIKGDDSENEILFDGDILSAAKYFNQVQMGFETWLKTNDHFDTTNSKVVFN